jgi:hypothetical protein
MSPRQAESPEIPKEPLREDEFLPFSVLMARLPEGTSRDAIRTLFRERGLPRHRIGKVTYISVRELIVATAIGGDEDQEE